MPELLPVLARPTLAIPPDAALPIVPDRIARIPALGGDTLRRLPAWDPLGHNDVAPGEIVSVPAFLGDGGYEAQDGIGTAYRGVQIFLEGQRSPEMAARLGEFEAHIDHALPAARHQLANLNLYAGANPDDAMWAKRYHMPGFRSLATSGDGHSNFWSGLSGQQQDFDHELGHVITTTGSAPDADAWAEAQEADRVHLAQLLERGILVPAKARLPLLVGADKLGITTYGEQALESGSQAEDWAESAGWMNRSRRLGWVAKLKPQGAHAAAPSKLDFGHVYGHRDSLLDTYLAGLEAGWKRR